MMNRLFLAALLITGCVSRATPEDQPTMLHHSIIRKMGFV